MNIIIGFVTIRSGVNVLTMFLPSSKLIQSRLQTPISRRYHISPLAPTSHDFRHSNPEGHSYPCCKYSINIHTNSDILVTYIVHHVIGRVVKNTNIRSLVTSHECWSMTLTLPLETKCTPPPPPPLKPTTTSGTQPWKNMTTMRMIDTSDLMMWWYDELWTYIFSVT